VIFPLYISPIDPTRAFESVSEVQCLPSSYACNAQVFTPSARFNSKIADGLSNTILFAEHYWYCSTWKYRYLENIVETNQFNHGRRATFADADLNDVVPVTAGLPPTTIGSTPDLSFQVAPRFGLFYKGECNPRIAQTPHRSGMLVAIGDGSVRSLPAKTAAPVYWALVTPDRGEVIID
jgi:hypothetical protein